MKNLLYLTLTILALGACTPKQQEADTNVLAKVGNEEITQEEFDIKASNLDGDFREFLLTPTGKNNFLSLIINEHLLLKAAKAKNLDSNPEYVAEIEAIRKQQEANLKAAQDFALTRLFMQKLKEDGTITVTEEEIKSYHKKYPYQITLLHILLEDPQKAAAVTREIRTIKSQNTFEDYARKFSIDPVTKKQGGRLPPFIPGEYLPQIEIPAANTPVMQVQGFIKTAQGFHIIMKIKEEALTYTQAKDRIKNILEKQKMDAYLNSLKEKYGVEVTNEVK